MEKFKAATVQMNALIDDLDHNLDVHSHFTGKAADAGCSLILFPELSVTSHYGDPGVLKFAEEAGKGRIFSEMHRLARKHEMVIAYGLAEIAHGTYYNSHVLVGPKGLIGVQRKLHASGDEYFVFRMGRSFETFDLGFCKVGTLICYDGTFIECWRILALRGVDLILSPAAGRSGGRGVGKEISIEDQLRNVREKTKSGLAGINSNAKDNGVFIISCNQAGYNGHSTHGAGASITDSLGQKLVRSEPTIDDHMICAELDPELLIEARKHIGFTLRLRRPELYGDLTKMI